MKCWFCDSQAAGVCAICGRGLCYTHAHFHDEMTIAKSDTSTGYASYYNAANVLKCTDCKVYWVSYKPER